MDEGQVTMSVQNALEITINNLKAVMFPVSLIEEAEKVNTCINNLRECIAALNESELLREDNSLEEENDDTEE